MTQTEALTRIAAYPFLRAEELSVEQMREIAREALAQPEQEPVAWMSKDADIVYASIQVDGCFHNDHIPLYTAPPQRAWVWLTDDEIEKTHQQYGGNIKKMMQAVEAKLKEKNT